MSSKPTAAPSFNLHEKPYLKFFSHAAKHPHAAVTGLFLGKSREGEGGGEVWDVVDAVPLCHRWTGLSAMTEVGIQLVDIYAKETGLKVVGYYYAAERAQDVATLPAHGHHVLQSLMKDFPLAFALVFNAAKLPENAALDVVMIEPPTATGGSNSKNQKLPAKPEKFDFVDAEMPERVRARVMEGRGAEVGGVVDFDDWLEEGRGDWLGAAV